jgi:hypothetical protein
MLSPSESSQVQAGTVASPAIITDAQGYTYASVVDRLCNRREETLRNGNIASYRRADYDEPAVRAYWQAFDAVATPCPPPSPLFSQCHSAGISAAVATHGFGAPGSTLAAKRRRARAS